MIDINELRRKNKVIHNSDDRQYYDVVNELRKGFINNYPVAEFEPIELSVEILKENLGFEVSDLGDFWQCEKGDFVLMQPKLSIISINMPFIFVLKSSIEGSVTFTHVHHLQNTYLDLKGEQLEWKS